jgi:hypothetical protein
MARQCSRQHTRRNAQGDAWHDPQGNALGMMLGKAKDGNKAAGDNSQDENNRVLILVANPGPAEFASSFFCDPCHWTGPTTEALSK